MGVSAYTYIGAYFEMPKTKVEIKTGEKAECPSCKGTQDAKHKFCANCGTPLVKVDVFTKKELSLHDIEVVETDNFYQPEGRSRAIIPSVRVEHCLTLCDEEARQIAPGDIDAAIVAYRAKAEPLLNWFKENGLEVPEVRYGVVLYYS